jgi:hypothetical protein
MRERTNQESMNQGFDEWTKTKALTPFRKTFHAELFFHLAKKTHCWSTGLVYLVPTPHIEILPLLEVESLTSMTRYAIEGINDFAPVLLREAQRCRINNITFNNRGQRLGRSKKRGMYLTSPILDCQDSE